MFGKIMEKSIKFTLLSANLRQISETNCERAEFNDFSTLSAFFWIFQDQFYVWNVLFRSLIYTDWILFSILFGPSFCLIQVLICNCESKVNGFPTSAAFLDLSCSILGLEHVFFKILDTYQLNPVFNSFRSLFCSNQIWICNYESRIQWFPNFICVFLDLLWSISGLKHVFLDPWCIPNIGSCFQSFWVIILAHLPRLLKVFDDWVYKRESWILLPFLAYSWFLLNLLIRILGFLEFLGTILQDLANSWISW